jgi:hypothetical protein
MRYNLIQFCDTFYCSIAEDKKQHFMLGVFVGTGCFLLSLWLQIATPWLFVMGQVFGISTELYQFMFQPKRFIDFDDYTANVAGFFFPIMIATVVLYCYALLQ